MTATRREGPYSPRATAGAAAEVVDARGVRVAYLPVRGDRPAAVRRRASVVAHALTHDELTSERLTLTEDYPGTISVCDGEILLLTVQIDPDSASPRADAMRVAQSFADGYIVARRMCLGPREGTLQSSDPDAGSDQGSEPATKEK